LQRKKKIEDGELLKEAYLTGADCLFEGFSNKRESMSAIQDLQLPDNTVTRRVQAISSDMQTQLKRIHAISSDMPTQLKSDLELCDWFSHSWQSW
jgi:hypothetical protein